VSPTRMVVIGMCRNGLKLRPISLAAIAVAALVVAIVVAPVVVALTALSSLHLRLQRIALKCAPWRSTPLAPRLDRPG